MNGKPSILFVGDLNVYSKGNSRLKTIQELGFPVVALAHTPPGDAAKGHPDFSLAFRVAWKLGFHLDTEGVNRKILTEAVATKPALVWIEKGNMIRPGTLRRLHGRLPQCVIASYSDDDMFAPANHTHFYKAGLKHYDVIFTTKSYNADPGELPALGARRVVMVDKAFDPAQHFPAEVSGEERERLGGPVGFIGSYEGERAEALHFLAKNGIPVRVWGNGWEDCALVHENLRIERRALVNTEDDLLYTKGICATDINLAFLRKANRDLQTDRSIEIPACGGFMLAEDSPEHRRLFENGHEAVFFSSPDDMLAKVRYYLEHGAEREAVARAGRERCVKSGYTHQDRMRFMLFQALARSP